MAISICKVHILSEGQKDLKKLPHFLDLLSNVKWNWEFFSNFSGLFRIFEVYLSHPENTVWVFWDILQKVFQNRDVSSKNYRT